VGFLSNVLGTSNQANPMDPDVVAKSKALAPVNNYRAPGDYSAPIGQAVANQGESYGQQQSFINSLVARSTGAGPSVAQNQLRQATDANTANVASQVASNRSLSPAAAARLAIEGGVQAQTQSAGQAATLRAQEQLANTSLLGQALGQQGSQNLGALGTLAGAQGNLNNVNAGVAGQNASLQLGQEQLAAGVGAGDAKTNAGIVGGVLQGGAAALAALADGGEVPAAPGGGTSQLYSYMSDLHDPNVALDVPGGDANRPTTAATAPRVAPAPGGGAGAKAVSSGLSAAGKDVAGDDSTSAYNQITGMRLAGAGSIYASGGRVPALVSPQEVVVPPDVAKSPARAGAYVAEGAGKVPGRAKVEGDSPRNDTVSARLVPGSIVVPRSITQGDDAPARAASFVASVMRRSDKRYAVGGKVSPGPAAELAEHQDLSDGGVVTHAAKGPDDKVEAASKVSTSRGQGGSETRRRIKPAKGPRKEVR
jgi:hypothetical protein